MLLYMMCSHFVNIDGLNYILCDRWCGEFLSLNIYEMWGVKGRRGNWSFFSHSQVLISGGEK